MLIPSTTISGEARASRKASESSMPGSVSKMMCFGMLIRDRATEGFHALQEEGYKIVAAYIHGNLHIECSFCETQMIGKGIAHGNATGDINIHKILLKGQQVWRNDRCQRERIMQCASLLSSFIRELHVIVH